MKFTDEDKKLITEAITKAESQTSGEILPVILNQSDFYPAAHFRLAIVFGMFASIILYYNYDFDDPMALLWIQLPGMILGYLLGFVPFFKRSFTTKSEMNEEVHQRAIEVYFQNKVSMTRDRTGIMIFVSLLERKVEVLADCGINSKVSKEYWDELVNKLVSEIATGNKVDGMITAIQHCGENLSKDFPIKHDDTNEVSDQLITE
jgi:putative membrane protein